MKKTGPGNIGDWRSHLLPCMDHIDSECIHGIATDVISVDPGDEHLAFVVVNKKSTQHGGLLCYLTHKFTALIYCK